MFCPLCGSEYREGFAECACCRVPLVAALDEETGPAASDDERSEALEFAERMAAERAAREVSHSDRTTAKTPRDHLELVTVLSTGDFAAVAIAKSILQSADIEFLVRGEQIQDLSSIGRFPTGIMNILFGPIEIQVAAEDAAEAREMLSGLQPGGE